MDPTYLTEREAAVYLRVFERTLDRYVAADKLVARKLPGGGCRFLVADLEHFRLIQAHSRWR